MTSQPNGRRAIERVLEHLDGVEGSDGSFRAFCPAHQPASSTRSRTSLAVTERDNDVGIFCHAGCLTTDVLRAVDLELRDLFDRTSQPHAAATSSQGTKKTKTTTLDEAVAFLANQLKGNVTQFEYPNASGQPLLIILRIDLDAGDKTFRQLTHHHGNVSAQNAMETLSTKQFL